MSVDFDVIRQNKYSPDRPPEWLPGPAAILSALRRNSLDLCKPPRLHAPALGAAEHQDKMRRKYPRSQIFLSGLIFDSLLRRGQAGRGEARRGAAYRGWARQS